MHCANLLCRERLTEQVDGGHLAAEYTFLVHFGRGTDVAFVEGLHNEMQQIINGRMNICKFSHRHSVCRSPRFVKTLLLCCAAMHASKQIDGHNRTDNFLCSPKTEQRPPHNLVRVICSPPSGLWGLFMCNEHRALPDRERTADKLR